MLNALTSGEQLCDRLIGGSQWIGRAAENGQYAKLNNPFEKKAINMADFVPATVTGYGKCPMGRTNHHPVSNFDNEIDWTYRKD